MILPIVAYGAQILRKVSAPIDASYPSLPKLLEDMWETMYSSNGVGLAAPQINKDIRLFVIDSAQIFESLEPHEIGKYPDAPGVKKVFINAKVIDLAGEVWSYNEGCLSIPNVHEDVIRAEKIRIQYYDRNFELQDEIFDGITARVILHEYDHVEGILFTSYLSTLKRRLIKRKLEKISKGLINVDYPMRFPAKKRR